MSEQTKKTPQRVRKFLPNVIESSSRSSRNRQSTPSVQASSMELEFQSGKPAGTLIADTRPVPPGDLTSSQRQQDDSWTLNDIKEDSDNRAFGLPQRQPIREEVLHNSVDTKTNGDRLSYPVSSSATEKVVLQMRSCPRKFAPQLVETNKRSFRRKETSHTLSGAPVQGYDNVSRTQSGTSTFSNSAKSQGATHFECQTSLQSPPAAVTPRRGRTHRRSRHLLPFHPMYLLITQKPKTVVKLAVMVIWRSTFFLSQVSRWKVN